MNCLIFINQKSALSLGIALPLRKRFERFSCRNDLFQINFLEDLCVHLLDLLLDLEVIGFLLSDCNAIGRLGQLGLLCLFLLKELFLPLHDFFLRFHFLAHFFNFLF